MVFSYEASSTVNTTYTKESESKILDEISIINAELKKMYNTVYASFALCEDPRLLDSVLRLAARYKSYDTLVVIGIGGSNLGTVAVCDAVLGRNYNSSVAVRTGKKKSVYFSDTVDSFAMQEMLDKLETDIISKKRVLINVISKSGTTTETIANFELFYDLLLKHKLPLQNHVVVTTDEGSKLWQFAEEKSIPALSIPKHVGGRYSVFSAVGLFPLAVLGLNIKNFRKGALAMRKTSLRSIKNPAMISALQYAHYAKSGVNIIESFVFDGRLESLGKWYRQLMGESLGKQYDVSGQEVWTGLTPTVAVGSTDLHSMAQLYLGGPKDKYINFIVPDYVPKVKLGKYPELGKLVDGIQKKTLSEIMQAIIEGITGALKKQERPYSIIRMTPDDISDIGEFMMMKEIEIVFLARILSVNPFDQPNVEEYKIITKQRLG